TLLSLAGFQVILIGRFWVIAEGPADCGTKCSESSSEIVRSEAEELRRGFGVQGKGAASPFIPCLSL
ncbi:MAG: hypothetical protein ABSH52_33580, partial [Terriglobia bacterium]